MLVAQPRALAITATQQWTLIAVLSSVAMTVGSSRLSAQEAEDAFGFQYNYHEHGWDWKMGSCGSRQRQSPIDLPASTQGFAPGPAPAPAPAPAPMPVTSASPYGAAGTTGNFTYKYSFGASSFQIFNSGRTFSIDLANLGYGGLTYGGKWHNFMNINLHAHSEHTFGGMYMPAELHLVHKAHDSDHFVIVAIPLNCANPPAALIQTSAKTGDRRGHRVHEPSGFLSYVPPKPTYATYVPPPATDPGFNPTTQIFLKTDPPAMNMQAVVHMDASGPLDLNSLYSGATFYSYEGSWTAPPCAEVVTWLVRATPLTISDRQAQVMHERIYAMTSGAGNYRHTVPLNGRIVDTVQSIFDTAAPPATASEEVNSDMTDREILTRRWATNALKLTKEAVDHLKAIDAAAIDASRTNMEMLATTSPFPAAGQHFQGGSTPMPNILAAPATQAPTLNFARQGQRRLPDASRTASELPPRYPVDYLTGQDLVEAVEHMAPGIAARTQATIADAAQGLATARHQELVVSAATL